MGWTGLYSEQIYSNGFFFLKNDIDVFKTLLQKAPAEVVKDLSSEEIQQFEIVAELTTTEEHYVKDLSIIIDVIYLVAFFFFISLGLTWSSSRCFYNQ